MTSTMRKNPMLGRRWEGQHAEAYAITPSPGDEFWAWDTGYVLREENDEWTVWFRTLPLDIKMLAYGSTFLTESF